RTPKKNAQIISFTADATHERSRSIGGHTD
ncbi:MAG: hypothetical protein ACI81V_001566, partial [Lentimonas sp.]